MLIFTIKTVKLQGTKKIWISILNLRAIWTLKGDKGGLLSLFPLQFNTIRPSLV